MTKVFIDGAAGTTGIQIRDRLAGRSEFSLIELSDAWSVRERHVLIRDVDALPRYAQALVETLRAHYQARQ